MSTIVYRNAKLYIDAADVAASLSELSVEYSAEVLDKTTFGADTRIKCGGLKIAKISGKGFFEGGLGNIEQVLFSKTGTDDVVFTVFPDGATAGATSTGMGFSMKGVLSTFQLGGGVGTVLPLSFAAESRGIS